MKSRLDILEELDIRCGQLDRCHSTLRHCGKKHFQNMVKGMRFCFFTAIAYAAVLAHLPRSAGIERQIKNLVYNNNGFGTYSFEFQTKDGTFRKEDGGIITKDGRGYVVRGEYGYIDPQGGQHLVRYVADANGFQPQMDDDFRSNDRRII